MKAPNQSKSTRVTREQIINGETTAGPLAVLLAKNPALFWTATTVLTIWAGLMITWIMNQI
jgi:hypothetical protein